MPEPCPFCPIMLPKDPSMWQPITPGATIGDIAACEQCAAVSVAYEAGRVHLLARLAQIRATAPAEQKEHPDA